MSNLGTPLSKISDKYDAIIIGAGIGGLVCGCYLAKAGMKVLIVEQHNKAGGYSSSFSVNGFKFDVGVHSLEGCGKGSIARLIRDFDLYKRLSLIRVNPSDIIVTPYRRIKISNEIDETIQDFQNNFPHQAKEIRDFFNFFNKDNFLSVYKAFKNKVFSDVLNIYFKKNKELREIICVLLRNIGLPSTKVAAINAYLFFKEYFFDNGYYPKGGMQAFADALVDTFVEYGGHIIFSKKVEKIKVKNNIATGVIIGKSDFIKSEIIVSSCDVTQTFFNMIDEEYVNKNFLNKLEAMIPSTSAFILFLGLKEKLYTRFKKCCALWYASDYDIDKDLHNIISGKLNLSIKCLMLAAPSSIDPDLSPANKETLFIVCTASFCNKIFWKKNANYFSKLIIEKAEKIIPRLSKIIQIKKIAIPQTFFKYTHNRNGAIHGWAPLPNQIDKRIIPEKSFVKGLFLAGQWTTQAGQGGIPMVVQSATNVAQMIMRRKRSEHLIVGEITK